MTDGSDLTSPIPGRDRLSPVQPIPLPQQEIPPQGASRPFAPLMAGQEESGTLNKAPSPMELAASQRTAQQVTPESLHDQVTGLNTRIDTLHSQLTPQRFGEMTDGEKGFLLTQHDLFQETVKNLSKQAGQRYVPPRPGGLLADARTFVEWLTHGQQQINTVANQLTSKTKGKISVAQMLRAQAQLLAAERAINFASAVVSKGADFITKMMQTQL